MIIIIITKLLKILTRYSIDISWHTPWKCLVAFMLLFLAYLFSLQYIIIVKLPLQCLETWKQGYCIHRDPLLCWTDKPIFTIKNRKVITLILKKQVPLWSKLKWAFTVCMPNFVEWQCSLCNIVFKRRSVQAFRYVERRVPNPRIENKNYNLKKSFYASKRANFFYLVKGNSFLTIKKTFPHVVGLKNINYFCCCWRSVKISWVPNKIRTNTRLGEIIKI